MTTHSRDSNPKAQRFFAQFRCPILILTVYSKHSWLLTSTLLYICETEGIWTPDLWHISSVQNRTSTSATYLASLLQLLTANFIHTLCTLIMYFTFHYLRTWRDSNPQWLALPSAWQADMLNQLHHTSIIFFFRATRGIRTPDPRIVPCDRIELLILPHQYTWNLIYNRFSP